MMNIIEQFKLTGKVALITGASRGLGRAIAVGLAQAGAKVAAVSRNMELTEETANEIRREGGEAVAIRADVKNAGDVKSMVDAVLKKFGRIDILVNNAGISIPKDTIDILPEEWDEVIDTNMKSVYLVCREAGRVMIGQKSGKVINISSFLGRDSLASILHYGASKAAIMHMTKTLAIEWAPHGINVNCIAPGWFLTDMTVPQQEGENKKFLLRKIPLKRFGKPEEIAGLAVFLSSGASDYMTGETVFIDGGYSIW